MFYFLENKKKMATYDDQTQNLDVCDYVGSEGDTDSTLVLSNNVVQRGSEVVSHNDGNVEIPTIAFQKRYQFLDVVDEAAQRFDGELRLGRIRNGNELRLQILQKDHVTTVQKRQYSGVINSIILNDDAVSTILNQQEVIENQMSLLVDLRQNFLDGVLNQSDVMNVLQVSKV